MLYRRPVAACHELLEMGATGLTVTTLAAGIETEILVQGGAVATLRSCYAGLEYFGPAPKIRRAVERGNLRFMDETELSLAAGLLAKTLDLPWMPVRNAIIGTDYLKVRPDFVTLDGADGSSRMLRLPAIAPDVAIIHVAYADDKGNSIFGGAPAIDRELAFASSRVVVTADRLVSSDQLQRLGPFDLQSFQVDALVEVPGGARPASCQPHYDYDARAILKYVEAEQ